MQSLCSEDAGYLRVLAQHLPTDRPLLTLDAGAHIGAETLLFSRFSRFRGKILAVEAHPASAELLRANVDLHPHYVTRIHAALTAGDAAAAHPTVPLSGAAGHFADWRVHRGRSAQPGPGAIEVPTITLRRALVRPLVFRESSHSSDPLSPHCATARAPAGFHPEQEV